MSPVITRQSSCKAIFSVIKIQLTQDENEGIISLRRGTVLINELKFERGEIPPFIFIHISSRTGESSDHQIGVLPDHISMGIVPLVAGRK